MKNKLWRLKLNTINGITDSISIEYLNRNNAWIEQERNFINYGLVHVSIFDSISHLVELGYTQTYTVIKERGE